MTTKKPENALEATNTQVMLTEEQEKVHDTVLSQQEIDLLMAEYNALREEIIKRLEIEYQFIALAIIAPGTILAIGFQTNNASLILLYPALAWLLALISLANVHTNHFIASYIKNQIESRISKNAIGWEQFKISARPEPYMVIHFLSARGIFIATEILALIAGIFIAKFDVKETIFLIIGIGSTLGNIVMVTVVEAVKREWRIGWPYSGQQSQSTPPSAKR